jgi:hypothetical protein
MSDKRYALEAAESLRRGRRSAAEHELGLAKAALEQAEHGLEQERHALQAQLAASAAAALLTTGAGSALELKRAASYAQRTAAGAREQRSLLAKAQARVDAQQLGLQHAQRSLAEARAGERVIERDRERWQDQQRRELEKKEQLEVEERIARSQPDDK